MKRLLAGIALLGNSAFAQCDLSAYKPQAGLAAESIANGIRITWTGERGHDLRAILGNRNGQPVVQELAARRNGGTWNVSTSGRLTPTSGMASKRESNRFDVSTARRSASHHRNRKSASQASALRTGIRWAAGNR